MSAADEVRGLILDLRRLGDRLVAGFVAIHLVAWSLATYLIYG